MKLHPLNQNFSWHQPTGPFSCITSAQALAYEEQGGFIFHDAFNARELSALLAELDPLEAEKNALLEHVDPNEIAIAKHDEIVFRAHTVLQSPQAKALANHTVMQGLVADLMDQRCVCIGTKLSISARVRQRSFRGTRTMVIPMFSPNST